MMGRRGQSRPSGRGSSAGVEPSLVSSTGICPTLVSSHLQERRVTESRVLSAATSAKNTGPDFGGFREGVDTGGRHNVRKETVFL